LSNRPHAAFQYTKVGQIATETQSIMSEASSNGNRLERLVRRATGVVCSSEKTIGYQLAMKLIGFKPKEVMNDAIYMWVNRRAKLIMADKATPVAIVRI
jgi:hypothetical protein